MEVRLNWGYCSDCGGRLALFRDGNRRRFVVCPRCNFVWELPGGAAAADKIVEADVPLARRQCGLHTVLDG